MKRRDLLKRGALGVAGLAASSGLLKTSKVLGQNTPTLGHHHGGVVGEVKNASIDPAVFLESFYYGKVSRLPSGKTLREYDLLAVDREIEVAPGVFFPAWAYNGQVPGPTLRCTEGDLVRVNFRNAGSHAHTIHFHGVHAARMDGSFELVHPGESFQYEFEARPFGLQLYHCHVPPFKKHMAKGLYGAMIIDPKTPRPRAREMVMVMNGFDTNFDGENEIYAANTAAFAYHQKPITVRPRELQRLYLVNALEFDPINSFHLHGNFFHVYRTGTTLTPTEFTDTVMMCQGERHILEFSYEEPGDYMFHAHQAEFTELGWAGLFRVSETVA
ncbi:MAG: copper oxidase [Gemmatimonadetes bacterium]|nr:copper oxidase [Gemmatimonadota bacterium]